MSETSIVVGTDGSAGAQAAVNEAARLAAALGGRVVVVSAYNGVSSPMSMVPEAAMHVADGKEEAEALLRTAAERLKSQGVPCDVRAVAGSAAEALIDVAKLEKASTIVVGSRGMRGARRLLGSVPNSVSHRAPCTVMIVRTD